MMGEKKKIKERKKHEANDSSPCFEKKSTNVITLTVRVRCVKENRNA